MHELSLAESILNIARKNTPPGATLVSVKLRAGPRRAVDRDAMINAWTAVLEVSGQSPATLDLQLDPWTLRCGSCGHQWQAEELGISCPSCGAAGPHPVGGNELQVVSIKVD